jgi:hypothetical protein
MILAVGYHNAVSDTPPATLANMVEMNLAGVTTDRQSIPLELDMSSKLLGPDTPNKWYKSVAGAAVDWEEIQGQIFLWSDTNTASTDVYALLEYEVEFSDPLVAAATPLSTYMSQTPSAQKAPALSGAVLPPGWTIVKKN